MLWLRSGAARDIEFDFGYLPYPKYDEAQRDYVVWSAGGMMALPATVSDPSRSGAILETLSAASHKYVKKMRSLNSMFWERFCVTKNLNRSIV